GRPVTGQHRGRRDKGRQFDRSRTSEGCLVTAKKEKLVLDQRSAQHSAKLVTLQGIPLHRKRVPRVENLVAHELKDISMKFVSTGFRYCVDGRGRVLP